MSLEETYLTESIDLVEVADAIRSKTGMQESLAFPEAFKSAVLLEDWPTEIIVRSTYSIRVKYSTTQTKKTSATLVSYQNSFDLPFSIFNNVVSVTCPTSVSFNMVTNVVTLENTRTNLIVRTGKFIAANTSAYSSSYSCNLQFNVLLSLDWFSPIYGFSVRRTLSGAAISGVGEMPPTMSSILKYIPARHLSFYPEVSSVNYFSYNNYITEIGSNSALTIGNEAFKSCSSLTKVVFPYCTDIGEQAFSSCSSLNSVSFPACSIIQYGAFTYCSSLSEVFFPSCNIVGSYAFLRCNELTTASFPVCTSISYNAFAECSSLKNISFPVCSVISGYAFMNCKSLTTVSFPRCSTILDKAFTGCTNLKSVYLLGSSFVTLTGYDVFITTPIYNSSYIGTYGSIYVPSSMLAEYKTRNYFSELSARLVGI